MRGEDAFLTVAEFAIALAGFTSVVVVFSRRGGEWVPADRFRIRSALTGSLGAGFFALFPSALVLLGASGPLVWRISSGLLAAFIVLNVTTSLTALNRLDAESRAFIGRLVPRTMTAAAIFFFVLQVANVLAIGLEPQPGLFFLGLLHQLGFSVAAFARTIFLRPREGSG